MLDINWSDVVNVITSIAPYLIAIGIVLVVAIAVTVAVNKRTVKAVAVRKLAHSETWLMALVASVVAIMLMLYGPHYTGFSTMRHWSVACCRKAPFRRLMSLAPIFSVKP